MARIEVEGLSRTHGARTVLDEVSFVVPEGQRCGILGPEGSGTSTLASILAGLEPADAGALRIGQLDALADPQAREALGYVPRAPGLDPHHTVRQQTRFAGAFYDMSESEIRRRTELVLTKARLEHLGGHSVGHLGPGARRRLALAQACLHDPDVLVLDEPLVGLDPEQARRMETALDRLADGRTVCWSTGDPDIVERACSHVVVLEEGRLRLDGRVDDAIGRAGAAWRLELKDPETSALDVLREHPAVAAVSREGTQEPWRVWLTDPDRAPEVLSELAASGAEVVSFAPAGSRLSDVVEDVLEGTI